MTLYSSKKLEKLLGGICITSTVCCKKYLPSDPKNINTQIARKSLELLDDGLETVAHASRLFPSLTYALCLVFGTQLRATEPSCLPGAAATRKTGEYTVLL